MTDSGGSPRLNPAASNVFSINAREDFAPVHLSGHREKWRGNGKQRMSKPR